MKGVVWTGFLMVDKGPTFLLLSGGSVEVLLVRIYHGAEAGGPSQAQSW